MQRYIEKQKLKQLEKDLEDELKKTAPNRTLVKTLRTAIAIQKDLLGE